MKLAAAFCAAASFALPSLVGAQTYPSYSTASQQSVKGSITGFNGAYTLYLQDDKGYGDNIQMHDGTVINPTGIKLQEGMRVTIYGYANGSVFSAYRIDVTGSTYSDNGYGGYGYGNPYYAYPGYGNPYYGYGYGGYGYGYPAWGIGIGFGWGWPWWGGGYWPGYYGGYYGGYPYYYGRYPYPGRYYRGPVPVRGGVGAPVRGGAVGAPVRGGMGAPVSGPHGGGGGMHGGGGGRPRG
jgi:hypothetical protein